MSNSQPCLEIFARCVEAIRTNKLINDRRVMFIGQFLVEICSGRSAEQVGDVLSLKLTDLDLAALRLLETADLKAHHATRTDERQMALLERSSARKTKIER